MKKLLLTTLNLHFDNYRLYHLSAKLTIVYLMITKKSKNQNSCFFDIK